MKYHQYGEIAVRALQLLEICECAEDAWNNAAMEISGKESIIKKSCPNSISISFINKDNGIFKTSEIFHNVDNWGSIFPCSITDHIDFDKSISCEAWFIERFALSLYFLTIRANSNKNLSFLSCIKIIIVLIWEQYVLN